MALPRDLTTLTASQTEFCVAFYAARPLSDIRRRQVLTEQQIGWAVEQRNDFALANLRVREEILRLAADRKLPATTRATVPRTRRRAAANFPGMLREVTPRGAV